MTARSQQPGYFDALYAADADPWGFETRDYERRKYAATLDALPRERFGSGLEVGCSIGVLTRLLAGRCGSLLGIDVVDAALASARARCRDLPHVRFARSELPDRAPEGPFDLMLLSEVLYYFDRGQIARLADRLLRQATPETVILLVHWLGPTPDYPLTGEEAVAAFEAAAPGFRPLHRQRTPDYRLDVLAPLPIDPGARSA
jgi:trans-aconitate methyltransferase